MQITIELPEDIAVRLESKWKDLPGAALESLSTRGISVACPHCCTASAAPCFRDADAGRRLSKGARNLRLLGRGFRTGPRNSSGAANERSSALRLLAGRCNGCARRRPFVTDRAVVREDPSPEGFVFPRREISTRLFL